jgi:hypothetical protein
MAKAKGKNLAEETEVVVDEEIVEESADEAADEPVEDAEPVDAPVKNHEPVKPKKAKKLAAPAPRDLDELMPSQMTRDEMLYFCKEKSIELPPAASNADIRRAIRIHLDNGKKVGPTL